MTDNVIELKRPAFVPRIVHAEPCEVILLPVVRIERHPTDLPNPYTPRRRTLREKSRDICGND